MDRILFPKKIAAAVLLSCALLLSSCYSGSKLVGGSVNAEHLRNGWEDTSLPI